MIGNAQIRRLPCLACLAPSSVSLRLDKHNRPYTQCAFCRTRTFMYVSEALRGLYYLAPEMVDRFQKLAQGVAEDQAALVEREEYAADQIRQLAVAGGSKSG